MAMPLPLAALSLICLLGLAGLLAAIVISDIRHRRISNRLCLGVAALAIPYWLSASPSPFAQLGDQTLLLLAASLPLLTLFALRVLGGGDVKLLAALMLWLRPGDVPVMVVVTSVTGALLGIVLLVGARLRQGATPSVPYGIAIATGVLAALADRFLLPIAAVLG